MDGPYYYMIQIEGHLGEVWGNLWSDWFDGLEIHTQPDGSTILSGLLRDQAALCSVINKIQSLNLTLVAVSRSAPVGKHQQ
jgi:hypothetical protein